MAWFDIELVELDPSADVPAIARALGKPTAQLEAAASRLPATVATQVREDDAEALFHTLADLGARIRLERRTSGQSLPAVRGSTPPPSGPALPLPDLPLPDLDPIPAAASAPSAFAAGASPPLSQRPTPTAPAVGWSGGSSAPSPPRPVASDARDDALGEARGSYVGSLIAAFLYPLRPSVLVTFAVTAVVGGLVRFVPFVGGLASMGVWAVYLYGVMKQTAAGGDRSPYSDVDDFGQLFLAGLRYFFAVLLPLLVILAVYFATRQSDARPGSIGDLPGPVLLAITLVAVVLPAALIAGGLNYLAAVQIIARAPVAYAVLWLMLLPSLGALLFLPFVLPALMERSLLLWGVAYVGGALAPVVAARQMGKFIWHHEHELGLAFH